MLGHRCDNPLGQRIGDGHVMASSHWLNRREWALRRHAIGRKLRDTRGARGRTGALRGAVCREPTALSLAAAETLGAGFDSAQLPLWDERLSSCEIAQMRDA